MYKNKHTYSIVIVVRKVNPLILTLPILTWDKSSCDHIYRNIFDTIHCHEWYFPRWPLTFLTSSYIIFIVYPLTLLLPNHRSGNHGLILCLHISVLFQLLLKIFHISRHWQCVSFSVWLIALSRIYSMSAMLWQMAHSPLQFE